MNDWDGLDTSEADMSDYLGGPTPTGPLVSPLYLGGTTQNFPSPGVPTPSTPGAGGLRGLQVRRGGLGDFTPSAICELRTLSKLAYLFFVNVSTGDTQKALATLSVYRSLYNASRHTIATGFSTAAQAVLPVAIANAAWATDTIRAISLTMQATLGASNAALTTALEAMPANMAQLAAWFPALQAAVGAEDAALRDYANTPTSGDYATSIGAIARDDLTNCLTPAPAAPTAAPAGTPFVLSPGPSSTTYLPAPVQTTYTPAPSASGPGSAAAVTGRGSGMLTAVLFGLVAYGGYLAFKDSDKAGKLSAVPVDDRMLARARRAALSDVKHMKCLPTADARRRVSMDELAGPKGEKLAEALAALPPESAMPVEELYFGELDRLAPGRRRCV